MFQPRSGKHCFQIWKCQWHYTSLLNFVAFEGRYPKLLLKKNSVVPSCFCKTLGVISNCFSSVLPWQGRLAAFKSVERHGIFVAIMQTTVAVQSSNTKHQVKTQWRTRNQPLIKSKGALSKDWVLNITRQLCKLKGLQKSNIFQGSGYWHDHQNSAHSQESNKGGTNFHIWPAIPLCSAELCIICLLLAELESWHPECLEMMNLHSFLLLTSQYYCHNETCNISAHRGLISFSYIFPECRYLLPLQQDKQGVKSLPCLQNLLQLQLQNEAIVNNELIFWNSHHDRWYTHICTSPILCYNSPISVAYNEFDHVNFKQTQIEAVLPSPSFTFVHE